MSKHRAGIAACAALLVLAPPLARAGLSLDEAVTRHRAMAPSAVDPAEPAEPARRLTSSTPSLGLPDALTLAAFGARTIGPPLLRPAIDGAGGVQLRLGSAHDGDDGGGVAWRVGLGWADAVNRQGARFQSGFNFDGSELSAALGPGRAYASVQRRHWGPSWVGSLILDEGAAPLPAIGWRKTDARAFESPWLAWLGPWNADVFIGSLAGHVQPSHPRLWGARVQFMPLDGLEIAASRVVEWGGSGRREGFGTFWSALVGHDNAEGTEYNPSNQLAGFDARYTLRVGAGSTVSVYGQAIGEDEAGGLPSMYLGSGGIDAAFRAGAASLRVFAERANTIAGGVAGHERPSVAYRHSTYLQGYTQQGRPLAFPAGGDVTLTSVGLIVDRAPLAAVVMLHSGRAHAGTQLSARPGRIGGADAEIAWRAGANERIGATLNHWREPDAPHTTRLQLWWQHLLR